MSKIFSQDDSTGITKYWHFDEETEQATIEARQDVTAIVEENKAIFNATEKHDRYGEFSRVASIPLSIFYQLKAEGKLDDQAYMKRWLNDPENRHFRVRAGQV